MSEKEVMAIIQELMDSEPKIRHKAYDKLWRMFGEINDEEAEIILKALQEALKNEKRKKENTKLLNKAKSLLKNYEIGDSFEKRKEIIDKIQKRRVEKKTEHKQNEELKKINERNEQIRLFKEARFKEERLELRDHTYFSKEAKTRLPVLDIIKTILRFTSALYLLAGVLVFFIFLDNMQFGILILGICVTVAIQSLLLAELLIFLLDFHDTNNINTNVRIKTLKVLEDISKSLKR